MQTFCQADKCWKETLLLLGGDWLCQQDPEVRHRHLLSYLSQENKIFPKAKINLHVIIQRCLCHEEYVHYCWKTTVFLEWNTNEPTSTEDDWDPTHTWPARGGREDCHFGGWQIKTSCHSRREDIVNVFSRTYLASNKADREIRMLKYGARDWIVPKVLTWLSESGTEGINVVYKGVSYYAGKHY